MQAFTPALGFARFSRRALLFVPLAIFCYSNCSWAQDNAAEAARQKRARKAEKPQSAPHVYTDEDLQRNKILTPQDQARVEARKRQQKPASGQQNADNLPANPNDQVESLGEVARRYRLEKAAREAAEAAKKMAPFPYEVPTPSLAIPKPNVAPWSSNGPNPSTVRRPELPALVTPLVSPLVSPRTSGNAGRSRSRISPFQPRPLIAAPPSPPVAQHSTGPSSRVERSTSANSVRPLASRDAEATYSEGLQVEAKAMRSIEVQRGDSWWKLAERYLGSGARWRELRTLNPHLPAPAEYLMTGSVIFIPESSARRAPSPRTSIVVRKGDTLWALAHEHLGHGSYWPCLAQANPQISDYTRLAIGSTLQLPADDLLDSWQALNSSAPAQR